MDRAWPGAIALFGARSTPVFALCAARRIGTNALDIKAGTGLQVINQFDKEFQEQSDDIIFQTILAANFLDIKNLLELMCKKVADEIKKCKTPDDIRDRFNIRQDYTPEEVEEVKKAHPWIYDKNAK